MEGAVAFACGGKASRPFLRRGEGVEKRVFASRYRKAITPIPATKASISTLFDDGSPWGPSETAAGRQGSQQEPPNTQNANDTWSLDGRATELASETQLLSVDQPPDQLLESGHVGSRFLRNSLKAAWASRQAEEELELEEFRALETQIKADVAGPARPRIDQGAEALPSNSSLLPSAPRRSYAAIHQQRPSQPSHGAPLGASRNNDQPARAHAGWASPQPGHGIRYDDAVGGLEEDADDEYTGGVGSIAGPELADCDESLTWGQQHHSSGRLGPSAGGRDKPSAATAASVGLAGSDAAASATEKARKGHSFDDTEGWNDTSSFYGRDGAAAIGTVRKGVTAVAVTVNGGRSGMRASAFFGSHARSPAKAAHLNDPWAAPMAGEERYSTDDCSGWSADQQQKLQPQPQLPAAHKSAAEEDRGPDQPFVRALFNKQQRQIPQVGGGRSGVKGPAVGSGKGRPAEPAGPSAAELERIQVLEEQLANVASERATLVRMRTELEKAANRLEQERQAWEKSRAEEQAKWEAQRDADEAKLRRDRRVLEKQSKALLKLPNKKERSAMEAAEAALEAERREGRAREARHKLTVERLRRQLVELQERNQELREEVRWYEAQQLERGWSGTAGAATGAGKGGTAGVLPSAKSRPARAIAIQTEPLVFLPPLESGAGGLTGHPDTATSRAASAAFPPQRSDGSSREGAVSVSVVAAGGRPKLALASASTGPDAGSASRLRSMQTSGRATAALGTSQPAPPTSWRAQRAPLRKGSGPGQWQGREQAYDMGDEDDDYAEEEVDEGLGATGDGELGSAGQPGSARRGGAGDGVRSNGSPSWSRAGAKTPGQASPSSYSYVQNDDAEVLTDDAGGPNGIDSENVSAVAWQQHQEFMSRMGLAQDDAMAMNERRRSPPSASDAQRQSHHFPGVETRQQRQPSSQQAPPWRRTADNTGDPKVDVYGAQPRPGTSGSGRISRPSEQQQQQYQQPGWSAYANKVDTPGMRIGAVTAAASMSQRGPSWQVYPDQGASVIGSGLKQGQGNGSGSSAPSSPTWLIQGQGQGPARNATGSSHSGKSAFFNSRGEAGVSVGVGFRSIPASAQSSSPTSGSGAGHAFPEFRQVRPSSPLRNSEADLNGVSQTLAALRMDRHVEAAAAAAAAAAAPCASGTAASGRSHSFPAEQASVQGPRPGMQRPRDATVGREGGWSPETWSPRANGGTVRGPAKSQNAPSGPSAWGPTPPNVVAEGSGWAGGQQRQTQSFHDSQQWQGFPQASAVQQPGQPTHRQPMAQQAASFSGNATAAGTVQWPNGTMEASAAGAASVAHSISYQQHLQGTGLAWPPAPQVAGLSNVGKANSGGTSSGGGFQGDNYVQSRNGGGGENGGGGGAGPQALLREVRHADGKTERMYASGTRLVLFANGTRKVVLPDGSCRVYFANGDIKWTVPAAAAAAAASSSPSSAQTVPPPPSDVGVVHYFYAEVATWHSTYGGEGGVEVFYFPSGQTEAHHPGHGKEILFPDGVVRVVTTEGEELDVTWDQLSWAVQQPQPRVDDLGDDDL